MVAKENMMETAPTIMNPSLAPPAPVETSPLKEAVKACQVMFTLLH